MTALRLGPSPLSRALRVALFPGWDSEPRFQHVLEQLPGAAFLVLRPVGALMAINSKAAALTEWTRDELMTRSLAEVVAPGLSGAVLEPLYTLEPGRVISILAVPFRTRSERVVFVDLRLSAFEDNGGILVLILASSVEERLTHEKEATQQARVLETTIRFCALFASPSENSLEWALPLVREMLAADAIALYRIDETSGLSRQYADGSLESFPPIIGPSEAQPLKAPFAWYGGQRSEVFLYQAARAAGWAYFMAHPVGSPPDVRASLLAAYRPGNSPTSQAAGLLAFAAQLIHQLARQIARESKLAAAQRLALQLSNWLAAVHAQIEEGVIILNRTGTIDEINGAATRMLGYRAEDVTGLPFEAVLVADDLLTQVIQVRLNGGRVHVLNTRLHRRSGEAFPVMARLQPLPPPGGCVLTLRDLSEVRANEVRQEHLDQLAYAGQATQSFAHEVRSPLNNITMGVQFLATRYSADDPLQEAFSKIQAECNRLSALMNDMLAWAKPIEPNLEPADISILLTRLLNRWGNKLQQRNVLLNFSAAPGCPPVLADSRLLEQVFVNLIDNALQAMPAGGHLSVTLQASHRGSQGQVVEVKITDSGPGIPDEVRRRIFDPFFTTKPDGTGLGLAISKRLVTILRGAMSVDSFPGAGTIFTVTLPALVPNGLAEARLTPTQLENPT